MKSFKQLLSALLVGVGLLSAAGVQAEGSRSLYPPGYETSNANIRRGSLDLDTGTTYLNKVSRRTFIYVYAKAGEHILVGSSNRTAGGTGAIRIYAPQSFGTPGNETIPGSATFTCSIATDGLISSRAVELAGPRAVIGGGNPTGYVPCAYQATVDGIYGVLFGGGSAGGNYRNGGTVAAPQAANNVAGAWDVTVRSSDTASTADLNGRAFTYAWSVDVNGNGPNYRLYSTLYYVTQDGYRYEQSMKGIDPNGGTFFGNARGFTDQGEPLYKDIRGTNAAVSTGIPAGVAADGAEYPIFFANVTPGAAEVEATLQALNIPLAPKPPQVNSFQFSYPPVSTSTSYVGQGGVFNFYVTDTMSFQIVISHDGVDWDPASVQNRVLTGSSGTGPYSVIWDGKNNAGSNMPVGSYQFGITGRNGEVHFPFVDVEGNANGGPVVTKLNGANSGGAEASRVYYDDRGYVTKGGTAVGILNGNLCGQAGWPQPDPVQALLGVDSSAMTYNGDTAYARWWSTISNTSTDCSSNTQGFGDAKGLNL